MNVSQMIEVKMNIRRRIQQVLKLFDPVARKNAAQFGRMRSKFYRDYWLDVARTIDADVEEMGHGFFKLSKNSQSTYVHDDKVMLDDHVTLRLAGNKPIIHKMLTDQNIAVPKYLAYELSTLAKADAFMRELGGRFVVKPASGTGAGAGVVTNILDEKTLRRASYIASAYSPDLVIEQQIPGDSYRLLYLYGELVDVIRRDPPVVVGNDQKSIKKLMHEETEKRLSSHPPIALHPLSIDLECKYVLAQQGFSLSTVPKEGEIIKVKKAPNQNSCYENHTVRDDVCPSLIDLGRDLAAMLDIKLAGVDIITSDISIPLEESGGVINEINTTPGLHHHHLVAEFEDRAVVGVNIMNDLLGKR